MATLVTPSAKSHERVKGRWTHDLIAKDQRDWMIYYTKLIFGTPVPGLMLVFCASFLTSRAGLELSAWLMCACTFAYLIADQFSRDKEFRFFRLGSDALLIGFAVVGILSALFQSSGTALIDGLGSFRWIVLLYLLAYSFELFPGLNRLFAVVCGILACVCAYALWQHFTGLDLLRHEALAETPIQGFAYFRSQALFHSAEIFATVVAMLLPFPAATILLLPEKAPAHIRYGAWIFLIALLLTLMSTYAVGVWVAGVVGLLCLGLLPQVRPWRMAMILILSVILSGFALYGDFSQIRSDLAVAETARAVQQRENINANIRVWQQNIWVGQGFQAAPPATVDRAGNIYFDLLAETGLIGLCFYLLFILSYCLNSYRGVGEIPHTHFWHRVLASAGLGSQVAFHAAGLYWATLHDSQVLYLFVFIVAALGYMFEHYSRGVVPDDRAL